jgi:hypothetical protein
VWKTEFEVTRLAVGRAERALSKVQPTSLFSAERVLIREPNLRSAQSYRTTPLTAFLSRFLLHRFLLLCGRQTWPGSIAWLAGYTGRSITASNSPETQELNHVAESLASPFT